MDKGAGGTRTATFVYANAYTLHEGQHTMSQQVPDGVLSTREAREHLSHILDEVRRLGAAAPVRYYGAHRRPEAAVMSGELAASLLELMDEVVILDEVRARLAEPSRSGTVEDFLQGTGLDVAELRAKRATPREA